MFKTYSSSSSLVITSRWFTTSRLRVPVSVRLVYCPHMNVTETYWRIHWFRKWLGAVKKQAINWINVDQDLPYVAMSFITCTCIRKDFNYRQFSNIRCTKSQNINVSRLAVVFAQSIEARCYVENEDVVGATPTGDAPTTSEWSTILLPTQARLILETLRYLLSQCKIIV